MGNKASKRVLARRCSVQDSRIRSYFFAMLSVVHRELTDGSYKWFRKGARKCSQWPFLLDIVLKTFFSSKYIIHTLLMFCLLNPQMNVCKPNPKRINSNFNRLESVTKIFCFHAISTDICVLFYGSVGNIFIIFLNNSVVFTAFYL